MPTIMARPFPPGSVQDRLLERLERSRNDPVYFNEAVLKRSPYWSAQAEWARAVVAYRVVAVETGNMTGKGFLIGGLVPWFLWTRKHSLVYVCGAGQTQIGSVLWKEIRRAVHACPFWKAGLLPMTISPGIKSSPATAIVKAGWQAIGFSTSTVERASGHHAADMLVIVDEASGVEPEAWEAIDSLGFSKLLLCGNPLKADGKFVEFCDRGDRDAIENRPPAVSCRHFNVPSTASPHTHLDRSPWGLADATWISETRRHHGPDSLFVRIHVDAIRPKLSNEQLIPEADLDRCTSESALRECAQLRAGGSKHAGVKRLGCDVGEGCGNARTVVFVRDDLGVLECHASRYEGPRDAAEHICRLAAKWGVLEPHVSYDAGGNTGKRLEVNLSRLGFPGARPYRGSGAGGKFAANARSACACAFARRLDPDFTARQVNGPLWHPFSIVPGPDWPAIREELLGLRYHLHGDQSMLENKEDFMERLGRSPDFADALTQTFLADALVG